MSSTILSSLGENVHHRNALATITDNWVVVREGASRRQILLSMESISRLKTSKSFKTLKLHYIASAAGCFLVSAATACSRESDGAAVPFALAGSIFLAGAQVSLQASLVFMTGNDVVRTDFGTLPEAANLVAAIRAARYIKRWGERPAYEFLLWLRSYLTLLV
jgi:hypothetical protein